MNRSVMRVATRRLTCSGRSAWCRQTIEPGEHYAATVDAAGALVTKWCSECMKAYRW